MHVRMASMRPAWKKGAACEAFGRWQARIRPSDRPSKPASWPVRAAGRPGYETKKRRSHVNACTECSLFVSIDAVARKYRGGAGVQPHREFTVRPRISRLLELIKPPCEEKDRLTAGRLAAERASALIRRRASDRRRPTDRGAVTLTRSSYLVVGGVVPGRDLRQIDPQEKRL